MLNGRVVLVVETEFLIALGIQTVVQALGAASVALAKSPTEAAAHLVEWSSAALAIVEVESDKRELVEFARQLSQSGIPVIGLSADSRLAFGVPELPGTPILIKPLPDSDLAAAIEKRLRQNP